MFEVKWIEGENSPRPAPVLVIEVASSSSEGGLAARRYQAFAKVCQRPRCDCNNIQFRCARVDPEADAERSHSISLWVDLKANSIVMTSELENDPEALGLARIIGDGLTEAEHVDLRRWFLRTKLEVIEQTELSDISIDGLPDATDRRMVAFLDVFPFGLALDFTLDDEVWAVDEQFCVQIGCECRQTILSFIKLMDNQGVKSVHVKDPPAIRYNYDSGEIQPLGSWRTGNPTPQNLLKALKAERPFWNAEVELRHQILQGLYLRQSMERLTAQVNELTGASNPGRQSIPAATPGRAAIPKAGRNDPCPCGSGKKFKKCCGRS